MVLRVHYTDPDAVVTVDGVPNKVGQERPVLRCPTLELFMSAGIGELFWFGEGELDDGDG